MTNGLRKADRRGWMLAMVVMLLALSAQRSLAQGMFYVEEAKDGRIYVFNDMKAYETWKAGGELAVSIERPGEGPNGETLIFDSEQAIHLYNFRHERPGEVMSQPEPAPGPKSKIGWKDGKTTFTTDHAELVLVNSVQLRFTQEMPEDGEDGGSFRVRRARSKLEGWIYDERLEYELQVDWADSDDLLKDLYVSYDFRGDESVMLKAGQFKVPFGRQELSSSGSQEFVDRSIVADEFARGRDIGVQLWGRALDDTIEWRAGVFNGAGQNQTANDNDKYQYDARVTWQPFGEVRYSEVDFESNDRPLVAVAVNYEDNDLRGSTSGNDVAREVLGVDAVLKYKGVFAFVEAFYRDNTPEIGADSESEGTHYQLGYLFPNRQFELAGRFAQYDPDTGNRSDAQTEKGIAASWYFNKHAYKVQSDYRRIEHNETQRTDDEFRVQLQFVF